MKTKGIYEQMIDTPREPLNFEKLQQILKGHLKRIRRNREAEVYRRVHEALRKGKITIK